MRVVILLLSAALLAGCASAPKTPPGSTEYQVPPYRSTVTVTGNDVPGPLMIRDASLWLEEGEEAVVVKVGAVLSATYSAWINGHGQLSGYWDRDGEIIDKVSFFVTYGEALLITLDAPELLRTDAPGTHTIRFVLEHPQIPFQVPQVQYEVVSPF